MHYNSWGVGGGVRSRTRSPSVIPVMLMNLKQRKRIRGTKGRRWSERASIAWAQIIPKMGSNASHMLALWAVRVAAQATLTL